MTRDSVIEPNADTIKRASMLALQPVSANQSASMRTRGRV